MTPIMKARNLGPATEKELNAIGVMTFEQMLEMGWQEVCFHYVYHYPKRLNLNLVKAVIGATVNQDWRELEPNLDQEAQAFVEALRNERS